MIRLWILSIMLLLGLKAGAQVDRQKLRAIIALPSASVSVNYFVSYNRNGLQVSSNTTSPKANIADLAMQSAARREDVDLLDRLAAAYQESGDGAKATAVYLSALDVLQKGLEKDPENARFLAKMGALKAELGDYGEAESLLRKSLQHSPAEWLAWQELSNLRILKIWSAILGKEATMSFYQNASAALDSASKGTIRVDLIASAKQQLSESIELADKAVESAPNAAEPLVHRALLRGITAPGFAKLFDAALKKGAESIEESRKAFFGFSSFTESLPDIRRAFELRQNDLLYSFAAAYYEYAAFAAKHQNKIGSTEGSLLPSFAPQERERMQAAIARIDSLAAATDASGASRALEFRSFLSLILREGYDRMELYARRAIKSRPDNQNAQNLLIGSLAAQKKYAELAEALESRLKAEDTVEVRVGLAKISDRLGKPDQSERHARIALKMDPESAAAKMMLTGVILKYRDNEESLREAGELLVKIGEKPGDDPDGWTDYMLLRGFYFALIGELEEARKSFRAVLNHAPEQPTAKQALEIVG